MRRSYPRVASTHSSSSVRTLVAVTLALTVIPPGVVTGDGGTAPQFFCGRSHAFACAGNFTSIAGEPGMLCLTTLHFLDFSALGPGDCGAKTPQVFISATIEDVSHEYGPFGLTPGFSEIPIEIPVESGPARDASVAISTNVDFPDGTIHLRTRHFDVAVRDGAGGGFPAFIINTQPVQDIIKHHPGDMTSRDLTLQNNLPFPVDGLLTVGSDNVSDLPDVVIGEQSISEGAFSLADPVGDAHTNDLLLPGEETPCLTVALPRHEQTTSTDSEETTVIAGGNTSVTLRSRDSGFAASGSMSEHELKLEVGGELLASIRVVSAADRSVPPNFQCPEGGRAATTTNASSGADLRIGMNVWPSANPLDFTQPRIVTSKDEIDVTVDGAPVTGTTGFSDVDLVEDGFARMITEISFIDPPAQPGDYIEMTVPFHIESNDPDKEFSIADVNPLAGAPSGFENFNPMDVWQINVLVDGELKTVWGVRHQTSAFGVTSRGEFVEIDPAVLGIEQRDDGAVDVSVGGFLGGGAASGATIIGYSVQHDFRGFAQLPVADVDCEGDVNADGVVDVVDLVDVILAWGSADPAADINGDGLVDVQDLVAVILNWGACA